MATGDVITFFLPATGYDGKILGLRVGILRGMKSARVCAEGSNTWCVVVSEFVRVSASPLPPARAQLFLAFNFEKWLSGRL